MKVVILGAGIIGSSTAYYLTRGAKESGVHVEVTVIERLEVACAASGKAGGFLGRSWGDNSKTQQLHRLGFDLHESLAKELGITSFRKLPTLEVGVRGAGGKRPRKDDAAKECDWLDGDGVTSAKLMDPNTAQVTPLELTTRLMDAAIENGAILRVGTVSGIAVSDGVGAEGKPGKAARKVLLSDGEEVEADCVIICMGPWSTVASKWLGVEIPMSGIKSNSVVYRAETTTKIKSSVAPFALFCGEDVNGCHLEVYPRPNNEVYLCGIGGSETLDEEEIAATAPDHVLPNMKRVAAAHASFRSLTASLSTVDSYVQQACLRPCTPDGLPIMGHAPGYSNVILACGHNCWGILWGPVSGLAMSELCLAGKSTTIDLTPFDPTRFQ